jgi:hypothetical protein
LDFAVPEVVIAHSRLPKLLNPAERGKQLAHDVEIAGVGWNAGQFQSDLLEKRLGSSMTKSCPWP